MASDLEAHRGGRALMPENTLPAFANALTMGVDTLELNVGVTADGEVVVSHERGLNPDLARDETGASTASSRNGRICRGRSPARRAWRCRQGPRSSRKSRRYCSPNRRRRYSAPRMLE